MDAIKLAQGKPAFTADIEMRGMLHAKVLHSPYAHARIKSIRTERAKALPGVVAVLTWQDIPGWSIPPQGNPIPSRARWIHSPWITKSGLWEIGLHLLLQRRN